jgi:hypothetical protein
MPQKSELTNRVGNSNNKHSKNGSQHSGPLIMWSIVLKHYSELSFRLNVEYSTEENNKEKKKKPRKQVLWALPWQITGTEKLNIVPKSESNFNLRGHALRLCPVLIVRAQIGEEVGLDEP